LVVAVPFLGLPVIKDGIETVRKYLQQDMQVIVAP
jgi:hypothetical protein